MDHSYPLPTEMFPLKESNYKRKRMEGTSESQCLMQTLILKDILWPHVPCTNVLQGHTDSGVDYQLLKPYQQHSLWCFKSKMLWNNLSPMTPQFSSVQSLYQLTCQGDMRGNSAEILFLSFLQEAIASSSWHGQGCPLFDVVHPAFPLLSMVLPMDWVKMSVAASMLDSTFKHPLWTN